jgi:hypothetical protein
MTHGPEGRVYGGKVGGLKRGGFQVIVEGDGIKGKDIDL